MSRVLFCVLSVAAALCGAEPALACRVYQSPETRMAYPYDTVIRARIERATHEPNNGDRGQAWRATARLAATVEGPIPAERLFELGRSGESSACDDGQPIAKVGDTWVLYLSKRPGGGYAVSYSYPLDLARDLDRRLR